MAFLNIALPWKKRGIKCSKSIILPNLITSEFELSSSASLPLLPVSRTGTTHRGTDDDTNHSIPSPLSPPPPSYHDESGFCAPSTPTDQMAGSRHLRHYTIEKREEEGNEDLPPYECTVYKMGYMKVKKERDSQSQRSSRRSWRKLYIVLWGTTIRAYKTVPMTDLEEKKPVWCYSMQDAEAGQASDYSKRRHVIRLRIHQGPQFLIRTKGEEDQLFWIEHLQASVNVSLDLDERRMPQFITSSRRRRRATRVQQDPNVASSPSNRQREGALI